MSSVEGENVDVPPSDTHTSPEGSQGQSEGHNVDGGPVQDGQSEEKVDMYNLQPSLDTAFHMGQEMVVDGKIVQQLSEGFIQRFLPSLRTAQSSVNEILTNQIVVMDTLEQENSKFRDCTALEPLTDVMQRARLYHSKLLIIKRDMVGLHDKAAKLKRRALKLQQSKQKEELDRAHQQERQLEKDHMLTAKVASPAH